VIQRNFNGVNNTILLSLVSIKANPQDSGKGPLLRDQPSFSSQSGNLATRPGKLQFLQNQHTTDQRNRPFPSNDVTSFDKDVLDSVLPASISHSKPTGIKKTPAKPPSRRNDINSAQFSRFSNQPGLLPGLILPMPLATHGPARPPNQQTKPPPQKAVNKPPVSNPASSGSQLFGIAAMLANASQGSEELPGWSDLGVKPEPLFKPFPMQDLVCSKIFCCDTIFDRQATIGCCMVYALQMKVNVPCCSCMGFEVVDEGLFPGIPKLPGLG
jgi:hypothetical protein